MSGTEIWKLLQIAKIPSLILFRQGLHISTFKTEAASVFKISVSMKRT